jgi:N-acetylglucosamine-6-phosphate deacetylase
MSACSWIRIPAPTWRPGDRAPDRPEPGTVTTEVRGRLTTGRTVGVQIADGMITDVRDLRPAAEDPWLAPGFIDLQVNGYAGFDVNAADVGPQVVKDLTSALQRAGTTSFVPTVVTAAETAICRSLAAVAGAREDDPRVAAAIPFIHVEGPFLSTEDGPRGAHAVEQIRPPDLAEFDRWQAAARGLIGIVTISPHWPDAAAFTREVVGRGTRVAVGHTHAGGDQIAAVVDAGATLSTHLGNAAHALLPRHPNYLWSQLAEDRLTAGLIADGHHLPADTLKVMMRAKTPDRVVLVSDATALAGMPPGDYVQPVGGPVRLEPSGRLSVRGTSFLAGSAAALADCVAFAAGTDGMGLATAVDCATSNPARVIGDPDRGVVRAGARADLVTFDLGPGGSLRFREILVGGRSVSPAD